MQGKRLIEARQPMIIVPCARARRVSPADRAWDGRALRVVAIMRTLITASLMAKRSTQAFDNLLQRIDVNDVGASRECVLHDISGSAETGGGLSVPYRQQQAGMIDDVFSGIEE